jgi:signal transduction histidine kinase
VGGRPRVLPVLCVGAAGAGAGVVVAAYLLSTDAVPDAERWAALVLLTCWSFVGSGVVAWIRQPGNRIGPLMIVTGVALLTRPVWPTASSPALYTATLAIELVGYATFVHLLLAFPTGRLHARVERGLAVAAYADVTVVQLVMLLVMHDHSGRNLLSEFDAPGFHDALMTWQERFIVLVLLGALAVLVHRWRNGTPPFRRAIEPVLFTGAISICLLGATLALEESDPAQALTVGEVAYGALALVPLGYLAGITRVRLARGGVGDLVVELGDTQRPRRLRDALARALGDPSLELGYAITDGGAFVDSDGRDVDTSARAGRTVTLIERRGSPVAALVHDPALAEYPGLVDAVQAAAGLALENERLEAELRAQLRELRNSRARIVEAGDLARRRLERNLHDGAQQRLVTLALNLRLVESRMETDPKTAATLVAGARHELDVALEELRELARGIHPAILTDRGLAAAVAALAERAPVRVEVEVALENGARPPLALEAAAYYVVAEALTNVAKYARATVAHVRIDREAGRLRVEVRDDGVGGADPAAGSGLRGLTDRVEALDGSLLVTSPSGGGTRIVAALPLTGDPGGAGASSDRQTG